VVPRSLFLAEVGDVLVEHQVLGCELLSVCFDGGDSGKESCERRESQLDGREEGIGELTNL